MLLMMRVCVLTEGAYVGRGCCTRHYREPVSFHLIKGYREQTVMENCNIEAIM